MAHEGSFNYNKVENLDMRVMQSCAGHAVPITAQIFCPFSSSAQRDAFQA
jgi:hypothetical protein